jgi:hypothetical protein
LKREGFFGQRRRRRKIRFLFLGVYLIIICIGEISMKKKVTKIPFLEEKGFV